MTGIAFTIFSFVCVFQYLPGLGVCPERSLIFHIFLLFSTTFFAYGINMYIKTKISNQISSLGGRTSEVSIQCATGKGV